MGTFLGTWSETDVLAAVEVEEARLVEVLVASLGEVGRGAHEAVFRFVPLGDAGLGVLVLGIHDVEGLLGAALGGKAGLIVGTGAQGALIGLLYLLVERLAGVLQLELLSLIGEAG